MNDLLSDLDYGDATVLVLLDMSVAFDRVDYTILLERLSARFGVSGTVLSWIRYYLDNRNQVVSVGGVLSDQATLRFGVPQGSVLGPILYIIYNSNLHSIVASSSIISDHYYSDDTQLYTSFQPSVLADQQSSLARLSSTISEQGEWFTANRLKLKESKTYVLFVSSSYDVKKKANLCVAS